MDPKTSDDQDPDIYIDVTGGTHSTQSETAAANINFEENAGYPGPEGNCGQDPGQVSEE